MSFLPAEKENSTEKRRKAEQEQRIKEKRRRTQNSTEQNSTVQNSTEQSRDAGNVQDRPEQRTIKYRTERRAERRKDGEDRADESRTESLGIIVIVYL